MVYDGGALWLPAVVAGTAVSYPATHQPQPCTELSLPACLPLTMLHSLACCRSIGDADLKIQGVSAEAETAELALQPGDAFVIVATDGLWDRVR